MDVILYQGDNIEAGKVYDGPPVQLLLWSTPYPGLRGFKVTVEEYLNDWLPSRVKLWTAKMNQVTGVYVQVVKFKRVNGWFDIRQLDIPKIVAKAGNFYILDVVPWDKLNAPPSGDIKNHDHDAYEFVIIAAKSEAYKVKYKKFTAEYKEKTKKKAAAAARPEFQLDIFGGSVPMASAYRQEDIEGQLSGGHAELNPEGAIQDNVIRISPTGDEKERPRVKGGSFPLALARRFILQYTDPGDLVCDPCGGAGTTVIEAIRNGRQAAAVELVPGRFDKMANWAEAEALKSGLGHKIRKVTL